MIYEVVMRVNTHSIGFCDLVRYDCPSSFGLNEKKRAHCQDNDCAACWLHALAQKGVLIPDAEK